MVRPERVELSTFSLGMKCSIHLSYGRTRGIIADFQHSFARHFPTSPRVSFIGKSLPERYLLFFLAFLMFLAPRLFPRATHQGNGWTFLETTAKIPARKPTKL